jgi:tRNA 5-methylaminomethyl-2-thiouridine biosynthesis bifunctional protein
MFEPIQPARLDFAPEGTPVSRDYDDIYHAAQGGPGQARHVFLAGNGLPHRWRDRDHFVILENGFGTGLNFLATWAAWRDQDAPCRLHYLAVEKHPFQRQDLARLHAGWPEFQPLAEALAAAWPVLTPGFHRLEFEGGRVVLTLMLGDAETCLRRLRARVDAFYLDGFDPRKNPAMWSPQVFKTLARLAAPEATLATWCVARSVRDDLAAAGFTTEKRPGYAGKRDMLVGRLAEAKASPQEVADPTAQAARTALIIGGGIAGCALAQRLATRGWQVTLLEAHDHLAGEGSGNLAGIVRPLLSRDDNIASRLNRACFLHARRAWESLERDGFPSRRGLDGVLQIARDQEHEALQQALAGAYPPDYVTFLDQAQASQRAGWPTAFGGWWFPLGGWASPPTLCRALVSAAGEALDLGLGTPVARLEQRHGQWQALDGTGRILAQAPVAILAQGAQAGELAVTAGLPITPVRGQVSHVPAEDLPPVPHALCCEGYLTPAVDGIHCLGASYAYDLDRELRPLESAGNLARLARMLPGAENALQAGSLPGRVGFRAATPDRLPLLGPLPAPDAPLARDIQLRDIPRLPGLYGLLGLGSRGLVWATLAAEALASQIHGDPLPLEKDLMDALDPARFRLRAHRRKT